MRPWLLVLLSAVFAVAAGQAQDEQALVRAETLPPHAMWLESLNLDYMTCGWERPRAARSNEGNPLRLKGTTYRHGVGTHAVSDFTVDLKGAATRFVSTVGVDDEKTGQGSVVFRVEVDGQSKFESRVLHGGDQPQFVSVDLTGAKRLVLRVADGGDGNSCDHADWAGALLMLDPAATARPTALLAGLGDATETPLPVVAAGRYDLFVTLPRGREYGIVQFSVDGQPLGGPMDLFWYGNVRAPRVRLGTIEPKPTGSMLRAEVVGRHPEASGCRVRIEDVTLTPPPPGVATRLAWVRHVGACDPGGMSALPDGGAFVTGAFWGTTTFGKGEPGETKLTAVGQRDIFLAKYRADGTLAWVKQAGGREDDMGNAVATMPDGGAVITGKLVGRAVFGKGEPGEKTTWAVGRFDAFVARFGADGSFKWCQRMGQHGFNQGQAVAVAPDASIWVAGSFWGQCILGLGEARETRLQCRGGSNYFVARYQPDGLLVCADSVESQDFQVRACLANAPDGGVVMAGPRIGQAVFAPRQPSPTRITAPAGSDKTPFVARYRADGALAWAKGVRSSWLAMPNGIAALRDGGVAVTGRFDYADAVLGENEPGAVTLANPEHMPRAFVAWYQADGSARCGARSGGEGSYAWGRAVAARPNGGVVVAGYFRGMTTFSPGEPSHVTVGGSGRDFDGTRADMFLAWYEQGGTLVTAACVRGDRLVKASGVAALPDGAVLAMGHFTGQTSFRLDGATGPLVAAQSEAGDIYLARYEVAR